MPVSSRRAYCVAFTPSEFRRLAASRDPRQAVWIAVAAYPESPAPRQEPLTRKLSLDLPPRLHEKVRRLARARNTSYSAIIRDAVRRMEQAK